MKAFVRDINQLCKRYKNIDKILNKLELDIDKPAATLYYTLFEDNIKYISRIYSNKSSYMISESTIEDYIYWYIFDNSFGQNGLCIYNNDKEIKVCNASSLYKGIFKL